MRAIGPAIPGTAGTSIVNVWLTGHGGSKVKTVSDRKYGEALVTRCPRDYLQQVQAKSLSNHHH
jgi:hypothetical protein